MRSESFIHKLIPYIPVIILMVVTACMYDYYLDLNDDVLMKDILSGMYSGEPSAYNIQMLYPLCALVAFLYRMMPNIAWYGIMLVAFQYVSLALIIKNLCRVIFNNDDILLKEDDKGQDPVKSSGINKRLFAVSGLCVMSAVLFASLMLTHLVYVQYTITVAMMAAAAASGFMAIRPCETIREFLVDAIPDILLIVIAYMLRTEMLLLMLPFVAAAFVYRLCMEKQIFEKKTLSKYLCVILLGAVLMLACRISDRIAYSSPEWQSFIRMFDARTELYDYQVPPEYEKNSEFYEQTGLSRTQALLFQNYDFGIDSRIDDAIMRSVAEYAGSVNKASVSFSDKLKEKLRIYIYGIVHLNRVPGSFYPWNIIMLILYLSCAVYIILSGSFIDIWKIAALFFGRSAIWLYILMGERTPDRITHSLYFIEIIVLLMLFALTGANDERHRIVKKAVFVTLAVMGILLLPGEIKNADHQKNIRADVNAPYNELYGYMASLPSKTFLIDTYSSVSYSEKMFDKTAFVSKANSNVLGGWAAHSPIEKAKLASRGMSDMGSGLIADDTYFCCKKDIDHEWIEDYYSETGIKIRFEIQDTIADTFEIISIIKTEN